ncbi:conserved exported hypothetical protein [metagenome]|uniref:DUF222 domain-containing protein n=1 Tax=metagenome TaxID=256318 RepID=A0A2P2CEB9_9ZZZZ
MFDQLSGCSSGSAVSGVSAPLRASDVHGWATGLAGLDRAVDDAELIAQLRALEDLKAAACAQQARIAVAFAESQEASRRPAHRAAGVAAQVALARRESPHRGGRLLGLARALVGEMPRTLQALESGQINEWRATLIVRETACVSRHDRTAIDAELWASSERVTTLGDRALAAEVRRMSYRVDPQAVVARARRAESERSVSLRPAPDTMTYLTALLPVAQGVAAYAALNHAADVARASGDSRARGQVMADTFVERVTGQRDASDVPVTVNLVMTDTSLLGGSADDDDSEPGQLTGYGPIPAGVARHLVAGATKTQRAWVRRLYQRDARLVALESRARLFPQGIADFIDLRDRQCRTPWCDAPIRHHDHVRAYADGGSTASPNGQGLCEACNYIKEEPGWRARPGPDGVITTTTPTGARYESPEPRLPVPRRSRLHPIDALRLVLLEYEAA